MIIDFRADSDHAEMYDVIDRRTGESLRPRPIWYADDEKGFYRAYVEDGTPGVFKVAESGDELVSEEYAADIEIRLKSPEELEALARDREEFERHAAELRALKEFVLRHNRFKETREKLRAPVDPVEG